MLIKVKITRDVHAKVSCGVNCVQGLVVHGVLAIDGMSCPSNMHNDILT